MSADPTSPPVVDSPGGFKAALLWGVQAAFARSARRIVCVDPDFAAWPWNEAALLESLTVWLRLPQRRLVLLASDYESFAGRHPRFVAWRRNWVHAIDTLLPPEDAGSLPSLLVDDGPVVVRLIDPVHWRGRAGSDEREAHQVRESVDAFLQRSTPGFPAYPLGL